VRDAVVPRPRDQVTEVAGELRRTQQKETVAVGERRVLTGAVEKVEAHRLHSRVATPFRGLRCNVAHTRANDDAVKGTQCRNNGRADLARGASHEDPSHCSTLIGLVMARLDTLHLRHHNADARCRPCHYVHQGCEFSV